MGLVVKEINGTKVLINEITTDHVIKKSEVIEEMALCERLIAQHMARKNELAQILIDEKAKFDEVEPEK